MKIDFFILKYYTMTSCDELKKFMIKDLVGDIVRYSGDLIDDGKCDPERLLKYLRNGYIELFEKYEDYNSDAYRTSATRKLQDSIFYAACKINNEKIIKKYFLLVDIKWSYLVNYPRDVIEFVIKLSPVHMCRRICKGVEEDNLSTASNKISEDMLIDIYEDYEDEDYQISLIIVSRKHPTLRRVREYMLHYADW